IDPEYHDEAVNVENQQKNLSSFLWWTRRVIAMRKNFKAFSRGSLEFLSPDTPKVLAFLRRWENETIVVVANLSRFAQSAELDVSRFAGCVPIEVFSRSLFRPFRKTRCVITLAPHASHAIVAHFGRTNGAILCDAIWDEGFRSQLFDAIVRRRTLRAQAGQFVGLTTSGLESQDFAVSANSHVLSAEQSNSSIIFDN